MNAATIHRRENGRIGHCGMAREMRTGGPSRAERWRALHVGGHQQHKNSFAVNVTKRHLSGHSTWKGVLRFVLKLHSCHHTK